MSKVDVEQFEFEQVSIKARIKSAIEAMLFASGEPLALRDICSHLGMEQPLVEKIIKEMIEDYKADCRGIMIINVNNMYQFVTKPENADYLQRLLKKNRRQSLSQASIESLAIIAYKQPITRIDIDEIRGVKSESALQKLVDKNLIVEVGRLEVPGRPILYGTTDEFLRQFGLQTLRELPSLDLYNIEATEDDDIE